MHEVRTRRSTSHTMLNSSLPTAASVGITPRDRPGSPAVGQSQGAKAIQGEVPEVDVGQLSRSKVGPKVHESKEDGLAELSRFVGGRRHSTSVRCDRDEPLCSARGPKPTRTDEREVAVIAGLLQQLAPSGS